MQDSSHFWEYKHSIKNATMNQRQNWEENGKHFQSGIKACKLSEQASIIS